MCLKSCNKLELFLLFKTNFCADPNAPVSQELILFVVPGQNVKLKTKKHN